MNDTKGLPSVTIPEMKPAIAAVFDLDELKADLNAAGFDRVTIFRVASLNERRLWVHTHDVVIHVTPDGQVFAQSIGHPWARLTTALVALEIIQRQWNKVGSLRSSDQRAGRGGAA